MGVQVGFTVGYYEQAAVHQPAAHVNRKSLRGPQGFAGLSEFGFLLGGVAGGSEALSKCFDFLGERMQQVNIRNLERGAALPQRLHPLGGPGDWSGYAPAHNQECDQRNQENLHQHAKEGLTPDLGFLCVDIGGVVHDRKGPYNVLVVVQRQRVDVRRTGVLANELANSAIECQRLSYGVRLCGKPGGETRSCGQQSALAIVNGDSGQVFAVAKLADDFLQGARALPEMGLDILRQALSQHFCPMFEILPQAPLLGAHFIVGGD